MAAPTPASCATAPPRRASKVASCTPRPARRPCSRASCRVTAGAVRTSTVASRPWVSWPKPGARWSTSTGRTRTSRSSIPPSNAARSTAMRERPRSTRSTGTAPRGPRCATSTPSSPRSAVTPGPAPARSTSSATRCRRSPRLHSTTRPRTSRSRPRRRCSPTPSPTATPSRARTRCWRAPASTPSAPRSPRSRAAPRSPRWPRACGVRRVSWPTSSRSCATRSSGSTTIPPGWRPCAPAATSCTSSAASTDRRSPT